MEYSPIFMYRRVPFPRPGYFAAAILCHHSRTPEEWKLEFLDLCCCFGQEMRRLAYDGLPVSSMYGAELGRDFFELGFNLFKDGETFTCNLIAADISALKAIARGRMAPSTSSMQEAFSICSAIRES
ncbi:hypothetical protein BJ878DRAFT_145566 [Calycina marina]|uniref:Uncharacterized protein n=1 Tax=Calycina marina TaxID=1763456 RepID=A0A9P7Z9N0_9HELO|nr:hypothetical protein BJ878DRAFT_145566 [Calycina marina]